MQFQIGIPDHYGYHRLAIGTDAQVCVPGIFNLSIFNLFILKQLLGYQFQLHNEILVNYQIADSKL